MKLYTELTPFNRQLADALLPSFPSDVQAMQSDDGTLLFRGAIRSAEKPDHVGTHVAVSLDNEVQLTLKRATVAKRQELEEILIINLGSRIRTEYNPANIGHFAFDFVATTKIFDC